MTEKIFSHVKREGTWSKAMRRGEREKDAWLLWQSNGGREINRRVAIKNFIFEKGILK